MKIDFDSVLKEYAQKTNEYLKECYPNNDGVLDLIFDAEKYSLLSGGKRIRAYLVFEFCKTFGKSEKEAAPYACAVEMIHAYSLIHDDLPCMDNDDYRRGKLTNHKVYGEAVAVLAGDALLTRAFETVSANKNVSAEFNLAAVSILAKAAGDMGMVGGQILDIKAEENHENDLAMLEKIHRLKTGAMIKVSAELGCLAAGIPQDSPIMADVKAYAEKIGYAFQIIDDILDVVGDSKLLGKNVGSDRENNKLTFMSFYSIEEASALAKMLTDEAIEKISGCSNTENLVALAEYLLERKY